MENEEPTLNRLEYVVITIILAEDTESDDGREAFVIVQLAGNFQ